MKKKKLKGFTLIELIVVMAIFGIILVAAMQLMLPASKVMVQSEHYENQQAVVTNISNYLDAVLTPAEFMDAYNGNRDPGTLAQSYAEYYYEGVLKSGSDVNAPAFATGKIHVLELDNSGTDTILNNYVYDADFTTGIVSVAYNSLESVNNAINHAYYDNYNLQIRVGSFDENTWGDLILQPDFQNNVSASNIMFTIKSETKNTVNGSVHTSYNTAFMALGYVFNDPTASSTASLNYYVIDEKAAPPPANPLDPPNPNILSIVQIATPNITARKLDASMANARWNGTLSARTRNDYDPPTNAVENYYFVYSYGSDINTNP